MTSLVSTHETKTWQPVELKHEITHPQPMTGLVLWPETARRLHETYGQAIQLEFSYCLPCKVLRVVMRTVRLSTTGAGLTTFWMM